MTTLVISGSFSRIERLRAIAATLALGVGLVFISGFSHIDNVHNAAHDTRHALSFPCH